ncbi:P-loop NTPase fold protein [Bacillus tropicus]|uniref:P-loop NTPase fold protein n=1 Tax=Bacillus tropicus TaxID=2026188 RepID=UPI003829A757
MAKTAPDFIEDEEYVREQIHKQWGGSPKSQISVSNTYPYIFIFFEESDTRYKGRYGWQNDKIFYYLGERQNGDMPLTNGNKEIQQHLINNKKIYLFKTLDKNRVKYVTAMNYIGYDIENTVDKNGRKQENIILKLKPVFQISHMGKLYNESEFESNIIIKSKKEHQREIEERELYEQGNPQGKEAISDKITNKDLLGRDKLVKELSDFYIEYNESNHSPFYFGIFARWGMGKSSVIEMLKNSIEKKSTTNNKYLVCKVDCSLFDKKDKLWISILNKLLDELSFENKDSENDVYENSTFSFKNKYYFKKFKGIFTHNISSIVSWVIFLTMLIAIIITFFYIAETKSVREFAAMITVLTSCYALYKALRMLVRKNIFLNDERREASSYFRSVNEYNNLIELLNEVPKKENTNIKVLLILDELDRIHKDLLPDIIELIQLFKGLDNKAYEEKSNKNKNHQSVISFALSFNHDVLFPIIGRSVSLEDKQLFIHSYQNYKGFVTGEGKDTYVDYYKLGKEYMDKYLDLSLYLEDKINYEKMIDELFLDANKEEMFENSEVSPESVRDVDNKKIDNVEKSENLDELRESEDIEFPSFTNKEKEIIKGVICKYASNVEPRKIIRLKNALILLKKLNKDTEVKMDNQYKTELQNFIIKFLEVEGKESQEENVLANIEIAAAVEDSSFDTKNKKIKYTNYFIHDKEND